MFYTNMGSFLQAINCLITIISCSECCRVIANACFCPTEMASEWGNEISEEFKSVRKRLGCTVAQWYRQKSSVCAHRAAGTVHGEVCLFFWCAGLVFTQLGVDLGLNCTYKCDWSGFLDLSVTFTQDLSTRQQNRWMNQSFYPLNVIPGLEKPLISAAVWAYTMTLPVILWQPWQH